MEQHRKSIHQLEVEIAEYVQELQDTNIGCPKCYLKVLHKISENVFILHELAENYDRTGGVH